MCNLAGLKQGLGMGEVEQERICGLILGSLLPSQVFLESSRQAEDS